MLSLTSIKHISESNLINNWPNNERESKSVFLFLCSTPKKWNFNFVSDSLVFGTSQNFYLSPFLLIKWLIWPLKMFWSYSTLKWKVLFWYTRDPREFSSLLISAAIDKELLTHLRFHHRASPPEPQFSSGETLPKLSGGIINKKEAKISECTYRQPILAEDES